MSEMCTRYPTFKRFMIVKISNRFTGTNFGFLKCKLCVLERGAYVILTSYSCHRCRPLVCGNVQEGKHTPNFHRLCILKYAR